MTPASLPSTSQPGHRAGVAQGCKIPLRLARPGRAAYVSLAWVGLPVAGRVREMSLSFPLRLAPAVLLALLGSACSSPSPSGPNCPGPRPAFHVTLTAKNGPLPYDTVVRVAYGGGIEQYDLASPPDQPEVVFCHQVRADGGAGQTDAGSADSGDAGRADAASEAGSSDAGMAGGPVTALICDLWTNSAATINVQGSGYPVLEQPLQAESDDCGIKTVDYQLVLGEIYDGGGM